MKRRACVALFVVLGLFAACGNSQKFDEVAWRQGDARERGRMAEDPVKGRILIGKSADDTQRLLGIADIDYGPALSYKIDLGWPLKDPKHYGLLIYLDSNRKVTEAKIAD